MRHPLQHLLVLLLAACLHVSAWAADDEGLQFDDTPIGDDEGLVQHPEWFKESFLDLPSDLEDAIDNGKRGLVVYFGQKRCPYCRQLMQVNFSSKNNSLKQMAGLSISCFIGKHHMRMNECLPIF